VPKADIDLHGNAAAFSKAAAVAQWNLCWIMSAKAIGSYESKLAFPYSEER